MQGQAVTSADGISLVGEVINSGDFKCVSRTFRKNWLFANANLFYQSKPGTSKSPINTTRIYSLVTPTNAYLIHKNVVLYFPLNALAPFAPSSWSIISKVKTC